MTGLHGQCTEHHEPLPPLENVDTKGEIFRGNATDITDTVLYPINLVQNIMNLQTTSTP